jgi:hypothetical protein
MPSAVAQAVKLERAQLRGDRTNSIQNQLEAKGQWCGCCSRPAALCRCIKRNPK